MEQIYKDKIDINRITYKVINNLSVNSVLTR
jgi:hypothetical protein